MQQIAAAYPAIAEYVDITAKYNTPPTSEGRHMFALKISDNVSIDEDETAMLIVGTHHAREINVPVIGLEAAERLTDGYGSDNDIKAAVDSHEIWIAPIWNPDGYNYVFTANNMWRKNRRVLSGGVGVDQNRNYAQAWNTSCAGSTSPSSDTYKGPSAASEPETQTMITWSKAERFGKVIDYHSSGREVLFAYRCLTHPFSSWMEREAVTLSQASGYGGQTREPSAEGEHYEWQFAQMGAYAFLIETGTEFQPPYQSALTEAALVWPGIMTVLEREVSVRGHVKDVVTGAPLAARIDILNVAFSQGETNASGGAYGAYHMFLPAGTYNLRFSAAGYMPVERTVSVTDCVPAGQNCSTVAEILMAREGTPPPPPPPGQTVVFFDDFETSKGWARNPNTTDTATAGLWERGNPESTSSSGAKQLGTTVSGVNDLVTGRLAGASSGTFDLDGTTSIQSPAIVLPSSSNLTLTFSYYFAHASNSSSSDYLRVSVVGTTTSLVLQEVGAGNDDDAAWTTASVNLSAFSGQTIKIRVDAADAGGASLVEAAVDDVKIVAVTTNVSPVAANDAAATPEDTAAEIAVLANDTDPNGDTLSVSGVTVPAHGTAVVNSNGRITYTPAINYNGPDSFEYTIGDGHAGADTATVTVTVTAANDGPVAANDTATTDEDALTAIAVLANDTDLDGDTLSVLNVSGASSGTTAIDAEGTITYRPAPNSNGTDNFSYTIRDGHGGTATATVSVTVTAVNDGPAAAADSATTAEDNAVTTSVLPNDSDADSDPLTVTGIIQPAHGSAAISGGKIVYTPAANYHGADSVTYTIGDGHGATAEATLSLTVTPVNDGPVAVPDTATTAEDTAATIAVLTNDSDVDGDTVSVSGVDAAAHGLVAINADGTLTYTPAGNYNGADAFAYTLGDGNGGSATAVVNVTVTGVNDAPVAAHDTATTTEDAAVTIAVMQNDSDADGDTLALTSVSAPAHGSAVINQNGTIAYTPLPNYNGPDSFGYTIGDGNGGSATQSVELTVTAVNDGPVAVDDVSTTFEDIVAMVPVLLNDRDLDGDTLTLTAVSAPEHGTTAIQPDRRIAYMPAPDYNGVDSFTYTLSDGHGGSSTARVSVTVRPVNDHPTAFDDAVTTEEDTAATVAVLANDTDVDGDTIRVATVRVPSHGTTAINPDGTIAYTPARNYSGTDRFTYTLTDSRRQHRHGDGQRDGHARQRRPGRGRRHGDDGAGHVGGDRGPGERPRRRRRPAVGDGAGHAGARHGRGQPQWRRQLHA